MPAEKVMIVDDDSTIRWTLAEALKMWGYEPIEAKTIQAALYVYEEELPAAVLLDIDLPDGSGLQALREIKKNQPQAIVIMITANVVFENAVEALRGGAYDFVGKPINLSELQVTLRNGLETRRLRKEISLLRRQQKRHYSFDQIIGDSPAMKKMISLARKVAESEASAVLLQGASGTGKELVAQAIHYGSRNAEGPFVAINCAAIPSTLLETELFGHEKGAFTDAKARKEGLFEQATGGTLFLDELGELEIGLQAKLLRVLEEGLFRRVGGLKDIPYDARIIAASNRNLKTESEAGRFRADLYYRLSVIQIELPPLCERGDDVLTLARHYINHFNQRLNKRVRGLSPTVAEIFRNYSWPGNVRELRNVIERVMILEDEDVITTAWLPPGFIASEQAREDSQRQETFKEQDSVESSRPIVDESAAHIITLPSNGISLDAVERSLVLQAIERTSGNQTKAAELLHVSRDQFRYRLKKIEEAGESVGNS